jgi:simple sugar transport system permease protein
MDDTRQTAGRQILSRIRKLSLRRLIPEGLTLKRFSGPIQTVLTFLFALGMGIVILLLVSEDPLRAVTYFFIGPFLNLYNLGNMLNSAVPLMFTGLGVVIAFKTSVFNLGGEGQVYSGALVTTAVCLAFPAISGFLGKPLALLAGAVAAALIAGFSGWLYARWQTNELLSTFLISAALILLVDYFITGPLDDPASNLLASLPIPPQYWLMRILAPSRLNTGSLLALVSVGLVTLFLFNTRIGYELRTCGLNREFALYGGIAMETYIVMSMMASGFFHGLAGGVVILGTYHSCIQGFSAGLGWNGIAVALIGRNHPLGVIPAALFFAYLEAGAEAAVIHSGVSTEVALLIQAVIFYLITAQGLLSWIPREGIMKHRGRPPLRGRRKM